MSKSNFTPEQKPASDLTKKKNRNFAEEFGLSLEDTTNEELELARKNCIKKLIDHKLYDENGDVVWNSEPFAFFKAKAAADTVNPSLWLNGKANYEAGVYEVVKDKIYQVRGLDIANITFVRTKTGWLVLDVTSCSESANSGVRLLEEALGESVRDRIRGVIISHSHGDHFGGIKGVVDEENVGRPEEGKIPIYVPAGFDEETVKENVFAGPAMFHRAKYQFGGDLVPGVRGTVSAGLGLTMTSGTLTYIRPTNFISEDTTITIDGLEVEFQLTPETEAPAEMNNYFPEYRAFWAAENCTATLHNLYPIRGAKLRDSANWWRFTEIALERYGKRTDVVFQSHNWPHANTPEDPNVVEDYLRNTAAVYKYVHDETLRLANIGWTAKEIAREITLPEKLKKVWYTRPYYGSVEINSRAVYNRYLGFYNGNPNELDPLTETEEARLFVEYAGSAEKVLEQAAADLESGEYRRAARAASYVVYVDPENKDARYIAADAFEQLAYSSESSIWRNAYLSGAKELREGTRRSVRKREQKSGRSDLIGNLTNRMALDYLGIVTDGQLLAETDSRFRLIIVDPKKPGNVTYKGSEAAVSEEFIVHVYHGTVLYYEGHTEEYLPYVKVPDRGILTIVNKQYSASRDIFDTDIPQILEELDNAVIDLFEYGNFPLIEPRQ